MSSKNLMTRCRRGKNLPALTKSSLKSAPLRACWLRRIALALRNERLSSAESRVRLAARNSTRQAMDGLMRPNRKATWKPGATIEREQIRGFGGPRPTERPQTETAGHLFRDAGLRDLRSNRAYNVSSGFRILKDRRMNPGCNILSCVNVRESRAEVQ